MQYAICNMHAFSLSTNVVPRQSPCIIRYMHYCCMHYDNFYCTDLACTQMTNLAIEVQFGKVRGLSASHGSLRTTLGQVDRNSFHTTSCHVPYFILPSHTISRLPST